MRYGSYDITVTYNNITRTYKGIEREMHEEFYVNALDEFNDELKKMGYDTNWAYGHGPLCSHEWKDAPYPKDFNEEYEYLEA